MSYDINNSPILIIQTYLVNKSLGSLPANDNEWPLYLSFLPDSVDNAMCLYDENPQIDGRIQSTGELLLHFGMRLRIRNTDYETGWAKAAEILRDLMTSVRQSVVININEYLIHTFTTYTGIHSMGLENSTKRRNIFDLNFITSIEEV